MWRMGAEPRHSAKKFQVQQLIVLHPGTTIFHLSFLVLLPSFS
jgi:hypothetical protein